MKIAEEEIEVTNPTDQLSNMEVLLAWLEEKENKIMLTTKAREYSFIFQGWFHLKSFMKTTKFDIDASLQMLNLLKLTGNLVAKIHKSGKYEEYKITLDPQTKLYVLKNELSKLVLQMEHLEKELDGFKKEGVFNLGERIIIPKYFFKTVESHGDELKLIGDSIEESLKYHGKKGTVCYLNEEEGIMKVIADINREEGIIVLGGYFSNEIYPSKGK